MGASTRNGLSQINFVNPSGPIPDEEGKLNFLFSHFIVVSQKVLLKAFIKPFEAPQRSVKIKI